MATKEAIKILVESKRGLSPAEAKAAMNEIMDGKATASQIGAFLVALRVDQLTPDVLASLASSIRAHCLPCSTPEDTIDIVGTGGDGIDTFNVSTAASIIVAAAGGKVMKHGNRSNSSKCGSADLLEAMGAYLDVDGKQAAEVMEKAGFCFLYAKKFHPAFRHVASTRRELGVRSVFNILGPLVNPCVPKYQLSGVYDKSLCPLYAGVFLELGLERSMVCISEEGLDEISPQGVTHCWFVENGQIEEKDISPVDFGLPAHNLTEVAGGEPEENKAIFLNLLEGKDMDSPIAHYVLENTAAALYIANLATDLKDGVVKAREAITSGRAKQVLDAYVAESSAFNPAAPPVSKKMKQQE